jgi:hypothetical protein
MQNGFRLMMLKEPDDSHGTVVEESDDIEDLVDLVTSRTILINHLGYDISVTDDEAICLKISDTRTGQVAGYLACEAL